MKILLIVLAVVVVLVAVLAIVIATRPDHFRVTRSATIAAPPAVVFAQVNNLHNWQTWSPWVKADPDAKTAYDGPNEGLGAGFRWDGSKVGAGHMAVIESKPAELVRFRLDFEKPFAGTNTAEFTFAPEGNGTRVTWSMEGDMNFIAKAFSLVMDCDKMCGDQFEQGLADLGKVAGTSATK